jgi:hypothetical protein
MVLGESMVMVGALFYACRLLHGLIALFLIVAGSVLIVRTLKNMWPY